MVACFGVSWNGKCGNARGPEGWLVRDVAHISGGRCRFHGWNYVEHAAHLVPSRCVAARRNYTMGLVILGELHPAGKIKYRVVPKNLTALADHIFPEHHRPCTRYGHSVAYSAAALNTIGNQVEHLAWIAFESGQHWLILGLACHAHFMRVL